MHAANDGGVISRRALAGTAPASDSASSDGPRWVSSKQPFANGRKWPRAPATWSPASGGSASRNDVDIDPVRRAYRSPCRMKASGMSRRRRRLRPACTRHRGAHRRECALRLARSDHATRSPPVWWSWCWGCPIEERPTKPWRADLSHSPYRVPSARVAYDVVTTRPGTANAQMIQRRPVNISLRGRAVPRCNAQQLDGRGGPVQIVELPVVTLTGAGECTRHLAILRRKYLPGGGLRC